jgi:hypothetical protein
MSLPEGWSTLGPIHILKKLGDKFKEQNKGKVEERLVQIVKTDVESKEPDWDKEDPK